MSFGVSAYTHTRTHAGAGRIFANKYLKSDLTCELGGANGSSGFWGAHQLTLKTTITFII